MPATRRRPPRGDAAQPLIRRATRRDLPAIVHLERACFQPWRQASRASLARSLCSRRQSVWVIDAARQERKGTASPRSRPHPRSLAALLVLWHHKSKLRVYDIATSADVRGQGYGLALMRHVETLARAQGCTDVSLEADAKDAQLIAWYRAQGYAIVETLPHFYAAGRPAVRLRKAV